MAGSYWATHVHFPRAFAERGASAFLDAIEHDERRWFDDIWEVSSLLFTPTLLYEVVGPWRLGVVSFPKPQAMPEPHLAIVVGRVDDPRFGRLFMLEESIEYLEDGATKPATEIGEWRGEEHVCHGPGPAVSDFQILAQAFATRVLALLS